MTRCERCGEGIGQGDGSITPDGLVCSRCELAIRIEQGPTLSELARRDDTKLGIGLLAAGIVLLLAGGYLLVMAVEGTAALGSLGMSSRVVGRGLGYALAALAFGVAATVGGIRTLWRRGELGP